MNITPRNTLAIGILTLAFIQLGFSQTSIEEQKAGIRPSYEQPVAVAPGGYSNVTLPYVPSHGERIVFIGNGLAERMLHFGYFETLLYSSFPNKEVTFRNMGFPGHTPAFRPEAGLKNPWAFPGAKKFRPEINAHNGEGHYPKPDEWLTILDADTVVAFFGFNESFDGLERVKNFEEELDAFVRHTKTQAYNGKKAPRIILVTPIAMEQHPDYNLPDAGDRNAILEAFAKAVEAVASIHNVGYVDLLTPTMRAFSKLEASSALTVNGVHLAAAGYQMLAPELFSQLFGANHLVQPEGELLREAIYDKSWMWRNDYRMLNGVHAYGGRWTPYGNTNYPEEIEKIRQMTVLRDKNIWAIAQGKSDSIEVDDSQTRELTPVETNYYRGGKNVGKMGTMDYLMEEESLKRFTLPKGYEVSVFATEQEFPNLQNPAQMQFDNAGRLWVSVIPSYPHYKPGDALPNDKILVYEDTDGDGRADKETIFADKLHVPLGFEITDDGVFISEEPYLTLHKDTDGDGRADAKEYLLDGFDSHDTHHAISAFETDQGGGLFLCEGRFLHSQVETPYGPQRMSDGGIWRFDPYSWKVERVMQTDLSNPWGVAHDAYGQNVVNDASGGAQWWMLPYSMKVPHNYEIKKVERFNYEHKVRPTVGSEFLYSSHFPDEVQGDYLYSNTIGFLGIKQFKVLEKGTALTSKHRQDLIQSSDGNFRPADLEIGPDGSLYFLDWHSTLIGHMQHSARDPLRIPTYGRIYRITYPSRPLVELPEIAGASVERLFENMKLPELQARRRSHRELRRHDLDEVAAYALKFAADNADNDDLALEALWATWGVQRTSPELLARLLASKDHRVRAAAVRVVRHSFHLLDSPETFLKKAALDKHGRVRLEAISAASWLGGPKGAHVVLLAATKPGDEWIRNGINSAMLLLKDDAQTLIESGKVKIKEVKDLDLVLSSKLPVRPEKVSVRTKNLGLSKSETWEFNPIYELGEKIFMEEGSCIVCHQEDGKGLANIYPPLAKSEWVTTEDPDLLIKIVLHGLWGKMEVDGVEYDPQKGVPPMTAFGGMYTDGEIAGVSTYVRNSWGNKGSIVTIEDVKRVREETKDQQGFLDPAKLLQEHSLK